MTTFDANSDFAEMQKTSNGLQSCFFWGFAKVIY